MNHRDNEIDGEKVQKMFEKLDLTTLVPHFMAIFENKRNMKINLSYRQDLYSQYADAVIKQVSKNTNDNLMDKCLALMNNLVYYKSIKEEFHSTMFMIQYNNEIYRNIIDGGKLEENLLSPMSSDGSSEMKNLSSPLSNLKSSYENFKTSLSKLNEMEMEQNGLSSKLKKYQSLPCNKQEIEEKISALMNEISS